MVIHYSSIDTQSAREDTPVMMNTSHSDSEWIEWNTHSYTYTYLHRQRLSFVEVGEDQSNGCQSFPLENKNRGFSVDSSLPANPLYTFQTMKIQIRVYEAQLYILAYMFLV